MTTDTTDETKNKKESSKLNKSLQKSIEDLITQQLSLNLAKESLSDAIKSVADKLGIKTPILKRRINMIIAEEQEGGEIVTKTSDIDFVEEYFTIKANSENDKD